VSVTTTITAFRWSIHTPTRVFIEFSLVDQGRPLNGIKFMLAGDDIVTFGV
jgi:hypothetical protein